MASRLFGYFLFILLLSSCAMRHTEVCVATVIHPGGKGRPSVIEYHADGNRYVSFGPRQRYLAKDERFQLVYNKAKPWRHRLIIESPLFLENERTYYTEGKVLRCVNGDYSKVTFSYEVNGKTYKKLQIVEGPAKLTRYQNCLVRYSPADPARSILIEKKRASPTLLSR